MAVTFACCGWHLACGTRRLARRVTPRGRAALYLLALVAALACASRCRAQDYNAPVPTARRNSKFIVTTRSGKKMVSLDGHEMPLFWAEGITQTADLDAYARTGFNTVVVRLGWRPTPDGSLTPTDLEAPRAFAGAAAQKGLHVIYSLPPAPFGTERAFRISAASDPYVLIWSTWVAGVIANLKDTPNLIGWMLPDDPRALPFYDDASFAKWLSRNYANVNVINAQWSAQFQTMDDVTLAATQQVIQQWRQANASHNGSDDINTQADLEAQFKQKNQRPEGQNFAFHPAALALAHYKWEAYQALLSTWAGVVRDADAPRLIFSGRLPDYAQLLSLPSAIDVSVPAVPPGVGEADGATHNPQAVDIARRGGRFAALPVLSTAGPSATAEAALPSLIPVWADESLTHGASGLGFASWQDLQHKLPLQRSVTATLERLQHAPFVDLWTQPVTATTAIVLTPLADGYTRQGGSEVLPDIRGLYGFAEDLVSGEPSNLVFALRWGTAFGGVDYLAPDDVASDDGKLLSHYGVLLLPQALAVTPTMTQQLGRYANAGGVVVADLGAGAAQNGGQAVTLPPALAVLFGIAPLNAAPVGNIKTLAFNLQAMLPHGLLPTWSRLAGGQSGTVITSGDGPDGAAFAGPVAFPNPMPSTVPLALAEQTLLPAGRKPRQGGPGILQRSMLTLNAVGHGYALFAPFQMWTFWRPGQLGFDAFHGDLMQRGAAIVQAGAGSLVPAPVPNAPELYPELANFPNAIALLNHNQIQSDPAPAQPFISPNVRSNAQINQHTPGGSAPTGGGQQSVIQTSGVGNFLWSNAACVFGADDNTVAPTARPAPISEPTEFEKQPQLVTLYVNTKPQEMSVTRLLPIRAQNTQGGPLITHISDYLPQGVRIMLWPNATTVQPQPQASDFQIPIAAPGRVRLTLYDVNNTHSYRILPNSHHRVTIMNMLIPPDRQGRRPITNQILSADAQGHLTVDLSGAALTVEIHAAP